MSLAACCAFPEKKYVKYSYGLLLNERAISGEAERWRGGRATMCSVFPPLHISCAHMQVCTEEGRSPRNEASKEIMFTRS